MPDEELMLTALGSWLAALACCIVNCAPQLNSGA